MTRTVLLGDIADINPESIGKNYQFGSILYLDTSSVTENSFSELQAFALKDAPSRAKRIIRDGDIVYSTVRPNLKHFGYIKVPENNTVASTGFAVIRAKDGVDSKYLYYWLTSDERTKYLTSIADSQTSTFPAFNPSVLGKLKIELPSLETQKKIADILGTIDEKIELNRKMNETLEQMGQALFRHYFIDNPEVDKWEDGVLGDIIINFDSKRKPLSSRQRAEMQGEYRYFGATSVMDYVNDYLFDGTYLLLAEDGSVIKTDGTPYLQYVWGKFWVNNHAHILQAKAPFTVEYLYLLLSQANVQSLISGAVQLKINQRAMNSFKIKHPPYELVKEFCSRIDPMFEQRRKNEEEIQTLINLRDTLLPRLINGKVKLD